MKEPAKKTASSKSGNQKKTQKPKGQTTPKAKKETKMDKRKIMNSIMVCFLSLVVIGGVCVFFIIASVMKDAKSLSVDKFRSQDSTPILSNDGEVLVEVGLENRQSITYDQLPQVTIDAFLAIEDSRYFTHNGFDLPRFAKSAFNNLRNGDLGQGGSTLTMQMVDNVRKSDFDELNASTWEKIEYKIQEIFLSMQAENSMNKEEILINYLNKVNFGYTARGIEKGAQYYFGKDVSQLNLTESAFLAGVVNAPNLFNPYKGTQWSEVSQKWINFYEYAKERRDETLYQMYYHGYISENEYRLAKNTELAFQLNGERFFHSDSNDTILDLVRKEALDQYGIDIYTTSAVVHTSIDKDIQQVADEIISSDGIPQGDGSIYAFPNQENYDVGTTLINTKTGEIMAMIGGRNFSLDDATSKNQVTERHQTGSTIKPLLDYAPGFDVLGYATSHTFADIPTDIYGDGRAVANSNHKYQGDVPFAEAVANSYNTTASQSLLSLQEKWGEDNIKDYMRKLGFDEDVVDHFNLQYGIGGSDMTSSTKTLAAAYAVFANDGKYIEPHIITKIEFPDDPKRETIVAKPDPIQTISKQAAYLMSDILHTAASTNFFMSQLWPQAGYTVYGKTGTSDWGDAGVDYGIPEGSIRDEWMVNYSGNYVVATWEGYNGYNYINDDVLNRNIPGRINRAIFDKVSSKYEMGVVENPGGISTISHVKGKYPYASPSAGMPSDMIISGMIRSDKAKLEALSADDLKNLTTVTASAVEGSENTLHIEFTPYPDSDKTKGASHTKQYNVLGIKFTGNVYYDPAFVFGRVIYKADIRVNGGTAETLTSNDASHDYTLSGNYAGQTIQVCGYYAYEHDSKKSNEVCSDVAMPQHKETVNVEALYQTFTGAQPFLDTNLYEEAYVNNLATLIQNAQSALANPNVTQEEVNNHINAIQEAVRNCQSHPKTQEPTAYQPVKSLYQIILRYRNANQV